MDFEYYIGKQSAIVATSNSKEFDISPRKKLGILLPLALEIKHSN